MKPSCRQKAAAQLAPDQLRLGISMMEPSAMRGDDGSLLPAEE
jgi:hypothetical protein